VPQVQEDAAAGAIGRFLIEESGGIGKACFGNTKVARIGEIEEVRAKLNGVALGKQPRSLRDAQVYVADPVGTQDVAAHVAEPVTRSAGQSGTDAGARRQGAEERTTARLKEFLDGHAGNWKAGV